MARGRGRPGNAVRKFFAITFSCLILGLILVRATERNNGPLFIAEPDELLKLEAQGFNFPEIAFDTKPEKNRNSELAKLRPYQSIAESLGTDLENLKAADPLLGVGMAYSHRLFDKAWLSSKSAFFELAGIVLRLDRAPFEPNRCGEVRLVYRLAYRTQQKIYSRLPMTVNAVFWASDKEGKWADCAKVAERWHPIQQRVLENRQLLSAANLKSLEINMQSVRWPSTVRPDFGGYAEYFLRVFKKSGDKFVPGPLENTPDVPRIRNSPGLKAELVEWIRQNSKTTEQGIAVLPEKFLAKKITSVALNGPARLANLPFRQILAEASIGVDVLRRLDDMTCSGCHQGRAVAGFHFTGSDRRDTDAVNAIFNPASAHFFADQPRRQRYLDARLSKSAPAAEREISLRSDHEPGAFGAFCDLGSSPRFACEKNFACVALNQDKKIANLGICQPVAPVSGSSCRSGDAQQNSNPHKDRITNYKKISCGEDYGCLGVPVGFPGGMCSKSCKNLAPGEVCGGIANLQGFNDCLGRREPFASCLSHNVRPGSLKACDAQSACRPDYICAKISATQGGCIPPYFLFQLRVDGHNF